MLGKQDKEQIFNSFPSPLPPCPSCSVTTPRWDSTVTDPLKPTRWVARGYQRPQARGADQVRVCPRWTPYLLSNWGSHRPSFALKFLPLQICKKQKLASQSHPEACRQFECLELPSEFNPASCQGAAHILCFEQEDQSGC